MSALLKPESASFAAVTRFSALARLTEGERDALADRERKRRAPAHREIQSVGKPAGEPLILLSGWACRTRTFFDGRRQILSMLLPGDLIGHAFRENAVAVTTVVALTEGVVMPAPAPAEGSGLAQAYAAAAALEEVYLYRQIARLGRLSAYERLADWLLETRDRLAMAGLASGDSFPMPLTQEALADLLGLTSVHINRTLQSMRRDGALDLRGGTACLSEPRQLADLVDYRPATINR
ncbi:Crp/Fnr family transcriptional regulator [Sphingomonas sp. S2-65]|uniref:Crp/Fnr family transcriptional regulator n=1 Tax=Sphingomonas sp. S2-65 TaxID=2903960 RepID=UPI001F1F39EB|nr:Crp/Fnr family transcriptional regulator [Sphingomonas sp. S2-65]UYY57513.1 Crp/Fnr family transcriptional regulator [Sphingomonas sp. S2-65]